MGQPTWPKIRVKTVLDRLKHIDLNQIVSEGPHGLRAMR
jgi:hypothetical protein